MREFERHLILSVFNKEKTTLQAVKEFGGEKILRRFWRIKELSPEAQDYFSSQLAPAVSRGDKLSLAETADNLLDTFEPVISGAEKIPPDRPLIVVANHWKKGPMRGMWEHFLISREVRTQRGKDICWMVQEAPEMQFGPLKTGREWPATAFVMSMVAKSYDLAIVTSPFKLDRQRLNGHRRDQFKLPVSAFRTLKNGGVMGFYPEAQASTSLLPAWWGSRSLIEKLVQFEPAAQVLPVGVYNMDKSLMLNFGRPFPANHVLKTEVSSHDYLMYEVARLLPKKLRGYYDGSSPR